MSFFISNIFELFVGAAKMRRYWHVSVNDFRLFYFLTRYLNVGINTADHWIYQYMNSIPLYLAPQKWRNKNYFKK